MISRTAHSQATTKGVSNDLDDALRNAIASIVRGDNAYPFAILGPHRRGDRTTICTFLPEADAVDVLPVDSDVPLFSLTKVHDAGVWLGSTPKAVSSYRLQEHASQNVRVFFDAYAFGPILGELDEHLLSEGTHLHNYVRLGAHPATIDGIEGYTFAVWAPNARRVSVVGDFCAWDGRRYPMRLRHGCGVWELFIPGLGCYALYRFEVLGADGALQPLKSDPYAFYAERPPATASIAFDPRTHVWRDETWMKQRAERIQLDQPVSIYEVHLGSWRRVPEQGNRYLTYGEIGDQLIPYVKEMGFTHVELMPVSEYPFDGSWGYQPVGLYAPTSRFGTPNDFRTLIDRFHDAGIGVILDWVVGHFPTDTHGLATFDGTHLYEHSDPREGFHRDWNTLIYNYGRREVRNFLLGNALFWLDRYHVDGLRVDAVASMLYRDYSREPNEWIPNIHGGREHLEVIDLLRDLNTLVAERAPGAAVIAEESTAWPGVSRPVSEGGLGFRYKWNMGWMNDTLRYMSEDPINRRYHHNKLTFGMVYAYDENFILPLSHDEVVHGKRSLLGRMPGDTWQRFANLRAYYGFMFGHPGKKLLFMGAEIAQEREWNHDRSLDWHLLEIDQHRGVQALVRDLNALYRAVPALHQRDHEREGFSWVVGDDDAQSVVVFIRTGHDDARPALVASNFTPVPRHGYRVGVPLPGRWSERINTDAHLYGGGGVGNEGSVVASPIPSHGLPYSVELALPPLATLILERET